MAAAFDVGGAAGAAFGVTSITTASFTIAATGGRAAVLCLYQQGTTSTGFTGSVGGTSGSAISGTDTTSARTPRAQMFGVVGPPSGSQTGTMGWSTAVDADLGVMVFNGCDTSSPFSNGTFASGATGAPTVTPSSGGTGSVSAAFVAAGGTTSPTQSTGFANISGGTLDCMGTQGAAGATHSWADSFSTWVASAVAVLPPQAPIEQEGYRFRNDDGSETTATWAASQDTDVTAPSGTNLRLRTLLNVSSGDPAATAFSLTYKKSTDSVYTAVPLANPGAGSVTFGAVGTRSNSAGATSVTPAVPAGRTSLSTLFAVVGSKNNATHSSSTTGWSKLDQQNSGASWTVSLWQFSGDPTTASAPAVTWTGSVAAFGQTWREEGAVSFGTVQAATGLTSTHTNPGVTTTLNGSRVMYVDAAAANTAIATPAGWTEDFDAGSATGATRNAGGGKDVTTPGASGAISVTGAAAAWVTWTLELAPTQPPILVSASANITAGGEVTTAQLTPPSGKSTSDFTTGRMWDDENGTDTIDIGSVGYTEVEWSLKAQSPAANGDVYTFRVSPISTYTLTPQWTIGSGGTNVALTGQAATASRGTLSPTADKALTGQAATASGGTLVAAPSFPLTGQAATAAGGSVAPVSAVPMVGQAATGAQGSVTPAVSIALTGLAATMGQGTLTPTQDGSVGLTGQAGTASGGSLSPAAVVALAGQQATASQGSVTPAASNALSGQAATTAEGSVSPAVSIGLTGLSMTAQQGTLTPQVAGDVTVALTGLSMTVSGGILGPVGAGAANSGGWYQEESRSAKKARIQREREKLGILPKPVQNIVRKLAKVEELEFADDEEITLRLEAALKARDRAHVALAREVLIDMLRREIAEDDEDEEVLFFVMH